MVKTGTSRAKPHPNKTRRDGDSASPSQASSDERPTEIHYEMSEIPVTMPDTIMDEGIRNRFYKEKYPGDAGSPFEISPTAFKNFSGLDNLRDSRGSHVLKNQNIWELAKWLMTSNLSGSSREKYFKLKIVSMPTQNLSKC